LAQEPSDVLISLFISLYLSYPIFVIVDRYAIATRAIMTMPEAAVNEDNFSQAAENEIRATWQALTMQPITISLCIKEPADKHLGASVLALYSLYCVTLEDICIVAVETAF
jgi:hypothetical protein